jgi:hypothetical protein
MSNHFRRLCISLLLASLLSACDKQTQAPSDSTHIQGQEETQTTTEEPGRQALITVRKEAFKQTTELLHLGHQLHIATSSLLNRPTPETLKQARQRYIALLKQWVKATPYLHMTALTNSGAPLINRIEKLPMLPGYLDQMPDYPYSGLIFDIMVPIEKSSVSRLHTQSNDEQVTLGLSAIEFLLFGFDQTEFHRRFEAQTTLPQEEIEQDINIDQLPNNRRRQLLQLQIATLVEDLSELHTRWKSNTGEDSKKLIALTDKNLKLTIVRSYQETAFTLLDALNAIQGKEQILMRSNFIKPINSITPTLVALSLESLKDYHQLLQPLWEQYPQAEKEEFSAVLNSLDELIAQHHKSPQDTLILELATNRSNQLIEIANDLKFSKTKQ